MTEAAITRQPGQAATHTIQQEVLPVAIERTVEHTTETIRGKTYPLTTIRENNPTPTQTPWPAVPRK